MYRNFGYDYYFLNNGSKLKINWVDKNDIYTGGFLYSDQYGNEIINDVVTKSSLIKYFEIYTPDNQRLTFDKNKKLSNKLSDYEYNGLVNDLDIIKEIIDKWGDKNLNLCSPNNKECSLIKYINPLIITDNQTTTTTQTTKEKIKINVSLPNESIVERTDFKIRLYIGDNKEITENNSFPPINDNYTLLDVYKEDELNQ